MAATNHKARPKPMSFTKSKEWGTDDDPFCETSAVIRDFDAFDDNELFDNNGRFSQQFEVSRET